MRLPKLEVRPGARWAEISPITALVPGRTFLFGAERGSDEKLLLSSGERSRVSPSVIQAPMRGNPIPLGRWPRPGGRRLNRRTPWLWSEEVAP